jgi:hypothetical protein
VARNRCQSCVSVGFTCMEWRLSKSAIAGLHCDDSFFYIRAILEKRDGNDGGLHIT